MLFGGGGKEGEAGGLNMMETIKKAQQACAARPWDATPPPPRRRTPHWAPFTRTATTAQVGVKVKELQEELTNTEIEATSADGGVTVTISGAQVPIAVTVSDELLAQGADAVSDAVTVAVGEAHKNSVEYAKGRMSELYKDIGLPMDPNAMG